MPKRKTKIKNFELDQADVKRVYEIMKKYLEFDNSKNFLAVELAINSFFRELQADVTAYQVNDDFGTGDHGGFFFTPRKEKNTNS